MIAFLPSIQIGNTVFKYESWKAYRPVEYLKTRLVNLHIQGQLNTVIFLKTLFQVTDKDNSDISEKNENCKVKVPAQLL